MNRRFGAIVYLCSSLCFASSFFSIDSLLKPAFSTKSEFKVNDLRVSSPENWILRQSAEDNGVQIFGFEAPEGYLMFYSKTGTIDDTKSVFVSGSSLLHETTYFGDLPWKQYITSKTTKAGKKYVASFATHYRGKSYYGYAVSNSSGRANMMANDFISSVLVNQNRSLTGGSFTGQKYYLGWGAAMAFDPQFMQNEVKYDVLHTHDIFTKDVGGKYAGVKYLSYADATSSNIKARWKEYKSKMTKDDMYIQYSSGHGSTSGLAVGVNYTDIRDNVLSFGAKESVIFIMACHSGGLVKAFDAKKSEWQNFPSEGRTLFVMASSSVDENSSTGPGTDPEEPAGSEGTAGSAFGHALWKALIGHADGYTTGVKDGYISLEEIREFTTWKTNDVGGHEPVSTGAYNNNLVMNRVPPKAFVDALENGTEGMSNAEIMEQIRALDAALSVR